MTIKMKIDLLLVQAQLPAPELRAEVIDAMWADFGFRVACNLYNPEALAYTITHGMMKSKNTVELMAHLRTYQIGRAHV